MGYLHSVFEVENLVNGLMIVGSKGKLFSLSKVSFILDITHLRLLQLRQQWGADFRPPQLGDWGAEQSGGPSPEGGPTCEGEEGVPSLG